VGCWRTILERLWKKAGNDQGRGSSSETFKSRKKSIPVKKKRSLRGKRGGKKLERGGKKSKTGGNA